MARLPTGETNSQNRHVGATIIVSQKTYTSKAEYLDIVSLFYYTVYVLENKAKGQRLDWPLAFVGSWQSGRLQPPYKWSTAQPFAGSSPALPATLNRPTGSVNYPQGTSSGRSQRTGLLRSTVIFAQKATKGKSEDDLSFEILSNVVDGAGQAARCSISSPSLNFFPSKTWTISSEPLSLRQRTSA